MRGFRFAIALVVSLAVPASALAGCVADHTSQAMAQMACCKKAKPDCGTASQGTMECCRTGNHPEQQQVVAKNLTTTNPLKTLVVQVASTLVHQPLIPRLSPDPVTLFAGTTSPPRFSFSALLI